MTIRTYDELREALRVGAPKGFEDSHAIGVMGQHHIDVGHAIVAAQAALAAGDMRAAMAHIGIAASISPAIVQ
jgi:hypothetical protein